jgi:hypothetical protein
VCAPPSGCSPPLPPGRPPDPHPPPRGQECRVERAQMQGRVGANARPSGHECRVERAEMSGPVGRNVGSSGRKCSVERARMSGRAGRNVGPLPIRPPSAPNSGLGCMAPSLLWGFTATSSGVPSNALRSGGKPELPCVGDCQSRRLEGVARRAPAHIRPLGRACAPARPSMCARSAEHVRPLGDACAPARPSMCARWAEHVRPLSGG